MIVEMRTYQVHAGRAPEFLNMKGDVATTAEFIRAYRARFGAEEQPLFVGGESYGAFRAAKVAGALQDQHGAGRLARPRAPTARLGRRRRAPQMSPQTRSPPTSSGCN